MSAKRQVSWTAKAALQNKRALSNITGEPHDVWRLFRPNRVKGYQYEAGGWQAFVIKPVSMPIEDCWEAHFPQEWLSIVTLVTDAELKAMT
jgi:hypothetical protein